MLRALREARGITQEGFAAHLGYGRRTIRRWEAGEAVPDAAAEGTLLAFCQEQALFRRYEHGPLAGMTLTAELLRDLIAAARLVLHQPSREVATADSQRGSPSPPTEPAPASSPARRLGAAATLPTALTPFFGRTTLLEDVAKLVQERRLITLTGPGGVGKTRLAIEVARRVSSVFADGVVFVSLASIRDLGLIPAALAQSLGVQEAPGSSLLDQVCGVLGPRRLLLVLDNWEHLLPAVPVVLTLLAASPGLVVLATSRAALRLSGEQDIAVPPLPLPPAATGAEDRATGLNARLLDNDAVRLFADRAHAARADFALSAENAPVVAAICRRLDGLPLAIELAAARLRLFAPPALLERLEQRLPLLTGGPRDLPARQQTLRDAIAWSYDLLPPAEQRLFRRLAVFVGGWTLDAATAVCDASDAADLDILDGIAVLVESSLVHRVEADVDDEPRFGMLETIREYALERLEESSEATLIRRRHAETFLALADAADAGHTRGLTSAWEQRLRAEQDNMRAAIAWSSAVGDAVLELRLAAVFSQFWYQDNHWTEGRFWLEDALTRAEDRGEVHRAVRARAQCNLGTLDFMEGDFRAAEVHLEAALQLAESGGDIVPGAEGTLAWAALYLGLTHLMQGDAARARQHLAHCVAVARELPHAVTLVVALCMLGDATAPDNPAQARAYYEESLERSRVAGLDQEQSFALTSLARLALEDGDYTTARALVEDGLALRRREGAVNTTAMSLSTLAEVLRCVGDDAGAAAAADESLLLSTEVGNGPTMAWALHNLGCVALGQGDTMTAATRFAESIRLARESGQDPRLAASLAGMAAVAVQRGRHERSARLLGAVDAMLDGLGRRLDKPDRREYEAAATAARATLGESAFADAAQAGHRLPRDAAVTEALAEAEC